MLRDLRYALRLLRRSPGFAAAAVAILAIGIGATSAIFTIVNAVLLRPLPFAEPDQLTMVTTTLGSRVSPAYVHDWRLATRMFQDLAGWYDEPAALTGTAEPIEVLVDRVTPNFFDVLGTPALVGRTFSANGRVNTAADEAVMSHAFWMRRFGGDRAVVGRSIALNGRSVTIAGVMPREFAIRTLELAQSRAEIWVPFPLVPGDLTGMGGILNVVGRLRPGVTPEQGRVELTAIGSLIERSHPSNGRNWGAIVVPLHEATVKEVRPILLVVLGASALLLLVACANIASLVLSRATARNQEVAVRLALGATAGRLLRQFLIEGLVLSLAGGVIGSLVAWWGTALLVSVLPQSIDLPRWGEIHVDASVLAFTVVLSIAAAVLFGVLPPMASLRAMPQAALRIGAIRTSSRPGGDRAGGALIVAEVALALVLLAGAGLLVKSFRELGRVDPGFDPDRVLTLRTTLGGPRYESDESVRAYGAALLERIGSLTDVRAVGFADYLPMSSTGIGGTFEIAGRPLSPPGERPGSWISIVGGHYFSAMGIPLLRGRLPGSADTNATQPIFVIDEELAQRYWPGADPIGERMIWGSDERKVTGEIVGVVGRVRWAGMAVGPQPTTYFWFPQRPDRRVTVVVRTIGNASAATGAIAAELARVDPNQPIGEIRALGDFISGNLARPRVTMVLVGSFAAAALLLAAAGLYGAIALAVAQRTHEIGIRIALGAGRRDVIRLVMRRGLVLIVAGLAIGAAAALALARSMSALLYGVRPADPAALAGAAVCLAAIAAVAMYLPARRAATVDPVESMRHAG